MNRFILWKLFSTRIIYNAIQTPLHGFPQYQGFLHTPTFAQLLLTMQVMACGESFPIFII